MVRPCPKRSRLARKTKRQKGYPKVEEIKGGMSKKWGTGTVVIRLDQ